MSTFAKMALVTIAVTLVSCERSNADPMHFTIRAPQQCPNGLTIKTKASDGMIEFDVSVDAEEIAHAGELYKGRVRAHADLIIATPEQQVAFVTLHGVTEGKRYRYQFRIAPPAAKSSELQLAVSLYEKDGMPTLGGGISMQVHLAGFEPKMGKPDDEPFKGEEGRGLDSAADARKAFRSQFDAFLKKSYSEQGQRYWQRRLADLNDQQIWFVRRQPFAKAWERVDAHEGREKSQAVYGTLDGLRAASGDCWSVEYLAEFDGIIGYLDARTGRLVFLWIPPEG